MLIGRFGETVVIDWGLAKDSTGDRRPRRRPDRAPGPARPRRRRSDRTAARAGVRAAIDDFVAVAATVRSLVGDQQLARTRVAYAELAVAAPPDPRGAGASVA